MTARKLHEFAQEDTPMRVNVPPGYAGILMWLAGRYGVAILVALACMYALNQVYQDYKGLTVVVLEALQKQTEVNTKTLGVMEQLQKTMEELSREARAAHRYSHSPANP
jgi:hypothetical protein